MWNEPPGAIASTSDTSDAVARALVTGTLSSAAAGRHQQASIATSITRATNVMGPRIQAFVRIWRRFHRTTSMLPLLPVTDAVPPLLSALAAGRNAVLVAPPGAGKTTLVPLALLDAGWRGDGRVLMLEPRRLATRAAAARLASLLGDEVGGTVGYRTRLDAAVSPATRIEVVTDGLLIRRLHSEPVLDGVV